MIINWSLLQNPTCEPDLFCSDKQNKKVRAAISGMIRFRRQHHKTRKMNTTRRDLIMQRWKTLLNKSGIGRPICRTGIIQVPLLNFEWVTAVDEAIPRLGVKGGLQGFRSPAKRTLDAWNREIPWPMAGCSGVLHPAMETSAAVGESNARVPCSPL